MYIHLKKIRRFITSLCRWIRLGQVSVHPFKKIRRFITLLRRWIRLGQARVHPFKKIWRFITLLRKWIRLGQVSVQPFKKILRFLNSLCRWIINDFRFSCYLHCKLDSSPHLSENKVNLAHALKSIKIRSAQERRKSAWEGPSNYMITGGSPWMCGQHYVRTTARDSTGQN